jgi:cation diffusion facilitator CzcD-associated flavoprotein CzcO
MIPVDHSPEERAEFIQNPQKYLEFRHRIEAQINRAQLITWRGTPENKAFADATNKSMYDRLAKKPEIYESLKPEYPVACRRISPGPRYLESLMQENVVFIPKGVERVTEKGVVDEDGVEREVDAIICATGFDTYVYFISVFLLGSDFTYSALGVHDASITGVDGVTLTEVFQPEPTAYYSTSPEKMPNLYLYMGPNGAPSAGSTLHMIEFSCDYMIRCIQKLQREGLKSMVVR